LFVGESVAAGNVGDVVVGGTVVGANVGVIVGDFVIMALSALNSMHAYWRFTSHDDTSPVLGNSE
jgi:hypothetical protein